MATINSVGGVTYISDTPSGEKIHDEDSAINQKQIKIKTVI